jgi:Rieske Fe-S protein
MFLKRALGCAAAVAGLLLGNNPLPILGETVALATNDDERRYPIPATDGAAIDQSAGVMLARYQGKVMALAMACPHQQAVVRWRPQEQRFQCSKHDSKYQPNGTYTSGRATRNLDRFPIRRDGDAVVVNVTQVFKSDQDAAGWNNAAVPV